MEPRAARMQRLRVARRRVALLTAVTELAGCWSLEDQTAALSRFAGAAVGAAIRHLLRAAAAARLVTLADPEDPEQNSGLIVLAMGKLGAGELNYSSDIDLILFFDWPQRRTAPRDGVQAFFNRLARDLDRSGAHLLRNRRPELGAGGADQGAAAGWRPQRGRAAFARARPVHLAQASRFRRTPGYPFDQAADQRLSRRGANRG